MASHYLHSKVEKYLAVLYDGDGGTKQSIDFFDVDTDTLVTSSLSKISGTQDTFEFFYFYYGYYTQGYLDLDNYYLAHPCLDTT